MAIQLYAKKQGSTEYVALDLHPADPMKMNLSVQNIVDPTAATSVFSKTFKVPHTSINGPYFKGVFNVNSMDFDAAKKADAYILDGGIFFQNGNITLNAIYNNDQDNSVEYEITFYGATSDFGTKIGGGFLNEVNLNKYNHSKDYANITNSWTGGLFNGDVVYGLIEWGYTYNKNNQPALPTLSANFEGYTPPPGSQNPPSSGSFTNPNYPLLLTQWKPQIRAKALWDQIFEEAGYTYDSQFLNDTLFNSLYVISENVSQAILDNANTFIAENNSYYSNVVAAQFTWGGAEISDPGNNYNQTSATYTAPTSGNYSFRISSPTITLNAGGIHQDRYVGYVAELKDATTGQVLDSNSDTWLIPAYDNQVYIDPILYPSGIWEADLFATLNPGQIVKVEFRTYTVSGGGPIYSGSSTIEFFTQRLECYAAPNVMSFNGIMPANIRKIDFMKSIINRFRLVFVPSKFQANHFEITPWKDWILQGDSKDWTEKLDAGKDMVIKPLFFDQERFQIYKDQEDADFLNYNYQLEYKQTFGQLNLDSTNELIKGTKEYKDQFAPTPLASIGWKQGTGTSPNNIGYNEAAKFLIPHIAKDSQTNDPSQPGKREPIQPKLRLVFYNGLQPAPCNWYMQGSAPTPSTTYPLMSQYSSWPVTSTTYDLNWENEPPFWDTEVTATGNIPAPGKGQTNVTTFNTYWKTWYDVTFDPYSRIVEANFVLDYNDILDLKFNDYVFVKDAWYFVNSISDYIPGQKTNCKVQLVKLGNNIGITVPVVIPPTLPGITTTFASTACDSFCNTISAGAIQSTVYVNGTTPATLANSTAGFQDPYGTIPATPGYYTDSSGTFYITTNGNISSCVNGVNTPCVQIDTTGCSCTPTYYAFTVQYNNGQNGCTICCSGGPLQVVYGTSSVFESNSALYTNTGLTNGVAPGFYLMPGPGANALQVGQNNGAVTQVFICSNCQCTTYYPFSVCFGSTVCDACCCTLGSTTIYGTNPSFIANTKFFFNNNGTTPAGAGYWKNGTNYAQITGVSGDVTSTGNCTSCTCQAGPVGGTINVSGQKPGYTTTTIVQKSYDNGLNWVDVAILSIAPDDAPNTSKSLAFTVENGVKLKAINSTTTVNGSMQTNYLINADTFENSEAITPATVTLVIPSLTDEAYTYEFNNIVTGGEDVQTSNFLVVGGNFNQYKTTTGLNDIIGLNKTNAAYDSIFNIVGGFTYTVDPSIARVESVVTFNNKIYVLGIFNQYKGQSIANRIACLNADGSLDTTFNTNAGSGLSDNTAPEFRFSNLFMSPTGKLYLADWVSTYNGVSLPGREYKLIRLNLNGTLDTSFYPGTGPNVGINDYITSIQFKTISGDEKLYLTGAFNLYNDTSANNILSLNSDATINTSFNYGTGFGLTGSGTLEVSDLVLYNDILYCTPEITGSTTFTYNSVTYVGVPFALNLDGTPNTAFNTNVTSGFELVGDDYPENLKLQVDSTGLYCSGSFDLYNGVASYSVAKLNFDGTLNTTFNNYTTAFDDFIHPKDILVTEDGLYVWGRFTTYRGFESYELVKINKTNGSPITAFNVGTAFQDQFVYTVLDINYNSITTYPIVVSFSDESPCAAYCNTPYSTTVYANAAPLINATILYANATGSTPVAAGYYSDGSSLVEVDGNGVIISSINIGTCNCNTLYQFDVSFASDECVSCGIGGIPALETVYGLNPVWSANTVLYYDNLGTTFAPTGWYGNAGSITLQVGTNGIVLAVRDCDVDCIIPQTDCREVSVINMSAGSLELSWQDCDGYWHNGVLDYGEDTSTWPEFACPGVRYGTLTVIGGKNKVIWGYNC